MRIARDGQVGSILRSLGVVVPVFIARASTALGMLVLSVVLGRMLGVERFGLFTLGFAVLLGVSVLARFGLDGALLKFAGRYWGAKEFSKFETIAINAYILVAVMALIAALLLYLSSGYLAMEVFGEPRLEEIFKTMSFCVPPYTLMYVGASLLKSAGRVIVAPFFEIGAVEMVLVAQIALYVLFGGDIHLGMVLNLLLLTCVLAFIASLKLVHLCIFNIEKNEKYTREGKEYSVSNLLTKSSDFAIISVATYTIQWLSTIVIGMYLGAEEVGVFNAALRSAYFVSFILLVFNGVMPPRFATLYYQQRIEHLRKLFVISTAVMACAALPVFFVVIFFSREILMLFGDGFDSGRLILITLASAQLFNVVTGSVAYLLNMTGRQRITRNIILVVGLANVILLFFVVPVWFSLGAALVVAGCLVVKNAAMLYFVSDSLSARGSHP